MTRDEDNLGNDSFEENNFDAETGIYSEPLETRNYNDSKDGAVMTEFFELGKHLANLDLKWKGLSIINGEESRTHDAIAPDRFIDDLILSIESVVSKHNAISTISPEAGDFLLWEKFDSFTRAVDKEPFFDRSKFDLVKDEYDHTLQLFMGHVKNSHGIKSAEALQSGLMRDYGATSNSQGSMLELGKKMLMGDLK